MSSQAPPTGLPVAAPADYLYIRKNGQGVHSYAVSPKYQQLLAEALAVLSARWPEKADNQAVMDVIIERARQELRDSPKLLALLKHKLTALSPDGK